MVKFFSSSRNKLSEEAAAATTPLMEEESVVPSPLLSREEEREARRKDRVGKREAMHNRHAGSTTSIKSSSATKRQLSQEEQDAKDVKIGCCYKLGQLLVKTIHLIDGAIGLTFIVYGSLIMTQFDDPAMEAAITSLTFGCIMLFSSLMGVIGFSTKVCKRCGLLVSAYTAPLIVLFYFFVIISVLASPDTIFQYLIDHMSVIYMNAAQIQTLKNLLPLFYIIIASLALVEVMR